MKRNRIMIAALKSGSGKTTITCALLQALKDAGEQVAAYKCGPDYIDPMFHKKILDISSKNLDTFFTGEEETKQLFLQNHTPQDFAVLEGVMGLYDGLGGIRKEGSSYHLATITRTPILLVVDAKGMGRSVIAAIAGFLKYDKEHLIKGVLLNRMSKGYYETLKPVMEEELHIEVVGYFPEQKELQLESRHLGLKLPDEIADIKQQLKQTADELQKTVSLSAVRRIAQSAEELPVSEKPGKNETKVIALSNETAETLDNGLREAVPAVTGKEHPVIAVAKDEAFCFYYEDNLRLLEEAGAELAFFSPIHDSALPDSCDALLLGGGYPELYAAQLSANSSMLCEIRHAIQGGMPVVAECGGFMYLHTSLETRDGKAYPMAGVLDAKCYDTGKLVRFGYIELSEKEPAFLPENGHIRGHEFHYFDSEANGTDCVALKPVTGRTYACVNKNARWFIGFPHLYYPSNPAFAAHIVGIAAQYHKERK